MITGWERLKWYSSGIEVWQTPSKYLTCHRCSRIFIFSETLEEAIKATKIIEDRF